jgi:acetyltransferase-like isoleucine patch superfamily enzyme
VSDVIRPGPFGPGIRPSVVVGGSLARLRAAVWFALRGVEVGHAARIYGTRPFLRGRIVIGERLRMEARQFRSSLTAEPGAEVRIGDRVYLNQGVTIHAALRVTIGDDVMVGDLAAIYDTNFHAVTPDAPTEGSPVVIGRNAWIGRGAVILPGVEVGENAVVAAGSVVTRAVAANSVVAGNPAREVRQFDRPAETWKRR